jgi:hypothetical protein
MQTQKRNQRWGVATTVRSVGDLSMAASYDVEAGIAC